MTTSGTNTFQLTRDQIITNALSLLGVVAAGESVTANDITYCASMLNSMGKAWAAQGIHLWTEEEGTVYFVNGQAAYTLAGANASDGTGTPVETTLTVAGSGSTITVANIVGIASGDNIGVQLSNNTIQWTTVNGTPSTTTAPAGTITLTASLTSSAALGNQVFTYTTALGEPLSIQNARVRDNNNFDRPIWIKPRQDYMMIPQKTLTGSPTVAFYTPQLTTGTVYLWPTPNDVSQRLKITYLRRIQDWSASSDNADFPSEWSEALTFNLAVRVAPAYGLNLTTSGLQGNPDIIRMANQFLEELKAWDTEQPYIKVIPNYRFDR